MNYDMISHVKTHEPNKGYEFPLQLPLLIPFTNQGTVTKNQTLNSLHQLPPLIPMPLPIQLPNVVGGLVDKTTMKIQRGHSRGLHNSIAYYGGQPCRHRDSPNYFVKCISSAAQANQKTDSDR